MSRILVEITPEVLVRSTELYNSYPFEELEIKPSQKLFNVLLKHDVQRFVDICVLHNHRKLPDGYVRVGTVGTTVDAPAIYLTKPTPVDTVDWSKVRGQIYSVVYDHALGLILHPSEFRTGSQDIIRKLSPEFTEEFIKCLMETKMDKFLGLGLAEGKEMIEHTTSGHSFLFGKGVVHEQYHSSPVTSWSIKAVKDNVRVNGEMRCIPTPDGNHIKAQHPETAVAVSSAGVISQLREDGVLTS